MERVTLLKVGGACAILYVPVIVVFLVLLLSSDLAEAEGAAEFLPILDEDQGVVAVGSSLLVVAPILVAIAGLGLAYALRPAGSLVWVGGLAFVGGGFALLYRAFVWLAMTFELAPAYVAADESTRETLAIVGDTLDTFSLGADWVGAALIAGIGVPLFSLAILRTGFTYRWVAWLGIPIAVLGGWLTLLIPLSEVFEIITFIVFPAFWVWMVVVGVALWRAPEPASAEEHQVTMQPSSTRV